MPRDALLSLLLPIWQDAIGVCVLLVLVISVRRLLRRGPSRMTHALVVTGSAALAVAVIAILVAIH